MSRALGARAAEVEDELVVEVAVHAALDADLGSAEIGAVVQIASDGHVRGQVGILEEHAAVELEPAAKRELEPVVRRADRRSVEIVDPRRVRIHLFERGEPRADGQLVLRLLFELGLQRHQALGLRGVLRFLLFELLLHLAEPGRPRLVRHNPLLNLSF